MARLASRLAVLAAAALSLGACEQQLVPEKAVEYRPEEAGTVDHAMCLLGFAAVPLRELSSGHHLVDATVNGRKATFILDTGANLSVVHAPEAQGMGLPEKGQQTGALGLGGGMKAQQVVLERMEIGGIPIRRNRIMTSDLSQLVHVLGQMSRNRIAGIIGQDVMKEHRAVIDVARPILFLIARDQDPAPVDAARCRKGGEEGESDADGKPPIRSG
jgi:clan AA aspartic protease (TIGR02281 family)